MKDLVDTLEKEGNPVEDLLPRRAVGDTVPHTVIPKERELVKEVDLVKEEVSVGDAEKRGESVKQEENVTRESVLEASPVGL